MHLTDSVKYPLHTGGILCLLFTSTTALALGPGSFWFDFKGSHTTPRVRLSAGEQHPFQFCATKEVVKAAHSVTWPGTPLSVTLEWSQRTRGGVKTIPWGGDNKQLPRHTKMIGPIADGRYCSPDLVVSYGSFPWQGDWILEATIDGTRIGKLVVDWTLLPTTSVRHHFNDLTVKHHAVIPPRGLSGKTTGQKQQHSAPVQRLHLPGKTAPAEKPTHKQAPVGQIQLPAVQLKPAQ